MRFGNDHTEGFKLAESGGFKPKNTADNKMSKLSETFNFSKEDRMPVARFNQVIWATIHGLNSICPAPVHAAFFTVQNEDDDD